MVSCEQCGSDDLDLAEVLGDGRRMLVCVSCGHSWARGEAKPPPPRQVDRFAEARRHFDKAQVAEPTRLARVEVLKQEYLAQRPQPEPEVVKYWARYQQIFSQEELQNCDPRDLKDFANNGVGANPGNMSVFNRAWNELGDEAAAKRTRGVIEYLLYGPSAIAIEDRLTSLISNTDDFGMTGFKESLLTRVLCIMQPERFLPILIYSSSSGVGKREIAKAIYDVNLPAMDRTAMTIGRLIVWSNDLLVRLAGEGFATMQHMSQFLWETKDREDVLRG